MDAVLAVAVFVGAYVFLVADRVHRTKVALVGAGLVLLLHVSDADAAFFDEESGIEWNVIFLLLGMMVIVSVLRQTGVFEYVAIWCAKRSRGRPYRLMVMLCVLTASRVRRARQRHDGAARSRRSRSWCASGSACGRCRS